MTNQERATIEQITRDFPTYDEETIKILKGRLTLNMYGPVVSEVLAPLVLGLTEENAAPAIAKAPREISYWHNTDGLGMEATLYAMPEGKRYSVVLRDYDFDTDTDKHISTLRTDSLDSAFKYAEQWTK